MAKAERLSVLYQIDQTFSQFCHHCPYFALNTPHKNCKSCPINGQLQDYGKQLGWSANDTGKMGWSEEEDKLLISLYGKMSITDMTHKLQRSYPSIYKRIRILKRDGILS